MTSLDRAIVKTLVYSDLFDYPLKGWEVQKWLIGKQASLSEVEKSLERLQRARKIGQVSEYFYLINRRVIVKKRQHNFYQSKKYLSRAKRVMWLLKIIPWIKMVGISGSLSWMNAGKKDDIDVFVVAERGRLWLCRLIILGYLEILGLRRKRHDQMKDTIGKFCVNTLLDDRSLGLWEHNIYLAHEVLQTNLIWQKEATYSKLIDENLWAIQMLPNWLSSQHFKRIGREELEDDESEKNLVDRLEIVAKKLQLWIMGQPVGEEKISDNYLFFHPTSHQNKVLEEYKKRCQKYLI